MQDIKIRVSIFLNYFVFAILLNSVGIVIMNVQQDFGITKLQASILEGCKDIPIAITSFLLASLLPKIGIKRALAVGLSMVATMCFVLPFTNDFWIFKLLFCIVGISFALIKISIFTSIGILTNSKEAHLSFMGFLEGFFMVGVLFGNLLFSFFVDGGSSGSRNWLHVYWWLGSLCVGSLILLMSSTIDESALEASSHSISEDLKKSALLFTKNKVVYFLVCTFLFVLVEQSFQTWTPTFFKDILKAPVAMSIQAGAVLAGAFAMGRFLSGFLARRISWIYIVAGCSVGFIISILLVLPLTRNMVFSNISWLHAPLVVYVFPAMGIFLSPIYPSLNSVILVSIPKYLQSAMSGLIVIFSAIGGTLGSMLTGFTFQHVDGQTAFYLSVLPLTLLIVMAVLMNKMKINI